MRALVVILALTWATGLAGADGIPWIGARVDSHTDGVLIEEVFADTPAARAGLNAGELVLSLDGVAIVDAPLFIGTIRRQGVGANLILRVRASTGAEREVTLTVGVRPEAVDLLRQRLVGKRAPALASAVLLAGEADATRAAPRVTVLEFWGTYCRACRAASALLTRWHAATAPRGARLLALSSEDPRRLTRFARVFPSQLPIAADPDAHIARAFGIEHVPTIIVIDASNMVRHVGVGYGEIEPALATATRLLGTPRR